MKAGTDLGYVGATRDGGRGNGEMGARPSSSGTYNLNYIQSSTTAHTPTTLVCAVLGPSSTVGFSIIVTPHHPHGLFSSIPHWPSFGSFVRPRALHGPSFMSASQPSPIIFCSLSSQHFVLPL